MERVVVSWSGGKESALALQEVRERSALEVAGLLTMVSAANDRISVHGVHRDLVAAQGAAMDIPVETIAIAPDCTGAEYAALMTGVFESYAERGVDRLVVGDVFLEDDDDYRAEAMDATGFRSYCPLLGTPTEALPRRLVDAGFEAVTVCVDGEVLDRSFLGRRVDESFLADLPAGVDPAGEGGEYHTFVRDGPPFEAPVATATGDVVEREVAGRRMLYCDLQPA